MISKNLELKKRISLMMLCTIALLAITCIAISYAHAESYSSEAKDLGQSIGEELIGVSYAKAIKDILFSSATYLDIADPNSASSIIMNTMTAAAMSIYIVMIIINLVTISLKGEATLDMFLRLFIKMAVTFFILTNMQAMTHAIHTLMSGFADTLTETMIDSYGVEKYSLSFNPNTGGMMFVFSYIAMLFAQIILVPAALIIILLIKIYSYSIILELNIRRAFMPFAILGMIEMGGSRGPGIRYIKKYAATYIKMMMFVFCFCLGDLMASYGIRSSQLSSYLNVKVESSVTIVNEVVNGVTNAVIHIASDLVSALYTLTLYIVEWIVAEIAAYNFARKSSRLCDEIMGL